ncbi:hypothetical protein GQ472_03780 [archaeon]|nr:hypothetical protein [archaeon]
MKGPQEEIDRVYGFKLETYIDTMTAMNLPVDSIKEHLEKGELPECIYDAIRYGIENEWSFHPDEFPFGSIGEPDLNASLYFDWLTIGLDIGYNVIEPSDGIVELDGQEYQHLKLNKAIFRLKEEIPDALGSITGAILVDGHSGAVANLLMYAAEVQYKSGKDFCEELS